MPGARPAKGFNAASGLENVGYACYNSARFSMDVDRWEKVAELYGLTCEQPAAVRDAFLREACNGDEELRREVESLLRQSVSLDGPLERVAEHARTAWSCPAFIGKYRILKLIGEGGMGAVYQAEQDRPRRTVALKMLKSAVAAPESLRRFSQESEVLGRLEHPGIARIYEAGTAPTDLGPQPYFAMEFIHGVSLLEYANQSKLSIRQRVDLMVKICEAVDHAHLCGVIHRDLKPGNILVDESGQPKILDFGVARVMDSDAHLTRQTAMGDLVGTLAYMSPEQLLADTRQLDARSDVYSLGVVLYELLAGRRPYETTQHITDAARVIREEDPLPLSAVDRTLRGDLETVLAKCLEKDKGRRYASAAELATDLRRYLADEPIHARPATPLYRARKFVRRHRALVLGTAAVFMVLLAGVFISAGQATRARRERDRALRAEQVAMAVNDFLQNDLLAQAGARAQANTHNPPDPDLKVRTAVDRAAAHIADKFGSQPVVEASIRHTLGLTYYDLSLYPQAEEQFRRAIELRTRTLGANAPESLASMDALGLLYNYEGRYAEAETLLRQVLAARERVLGKEHKDTLSTMSNLALAIAYEGEPARAVPIFAKVLDADRRILGEDNLATLSVLDNLAGTYRDSGNWAAAQPLYERELELDRRVLGPDHPDTANSMEAVGTIYRRAGDYPAADRLIIAALQSRIREMGEDHWETANTRKNLAISYRAQGRYAEADAVFQRALTSLRKGLGPEHPLTLQLAFGLGESYRQQRRFREAESVLAKVLEVRRRVLGASNSFTAQSLEALGAVKFEQHRCAEAETLLRAALTVREEKTPDVWERYYTQSLLGASLRCLRRNSEAVPLLASGYEGMLQRQSTIPAEYRPLLKQTAGWASQR